MGILSDRMLHCNSDSCLSRGEEVMEDEVTELEIAQCRMAYKAWRVVTRCKTERQLRVARNYVRLLGGRIDPSQHRILRAGLNVIHTKVEGNL